MAHGPQNLKNKVILNKRDELLWDFGGEKDSSLRQPSCKDESGPSGGHFLQLGRGSSVSIEDKTWLTEEAKTAEGWREKRQGPQASRSRGQQRQKRLWKP